MNGYDIFLLAILLASVIMGLVKGLIREVFSLVGVILGVVAALVGSPPLAEYLANIIPHEAAAYATAFLALFLGTLFLISLLGALLNKLLDAVKLGFPNRLLGGFFGLARGVLTVIILTLGLTLFLTEDSRVLTESKLVPHIAYGTRLLAPLLPGDVEAILLERLDALPQRSDRTRI